MMEGREWRPQMFNFPILELDSASFANVSGAGDSTAAGIVDGIVKGNGNDESGLSLVQTIYNGLFAGKLALQTHDNVSTSLDSITREKLDQITRQYEPRIRKIML